MGIELGAGMGMHSRAAVLQHSYKLWMVVHLGQLRRLQTSGVPSPFQLLACDQPHECIMLLTCLQAAMQMEDAYSSSVAQPAPAWREA